MNEKQPGEYVLNGPTEIEIARRALDLTGRNESVYAELDIYVELSKILPGLDRGGGLLYIGKGKDAKADIMASLQDLIDAPATPPMDREAAQRLLYNLQHS